MVTKKPQKNGSPEVCDKHKAEFIRLYPEHGTVGTTLRAIGVSSRSTFRYWCNSDKEFRETYENELLPNRRDEWVSRMVDIATNKEKVVLCPICGSSGKVENKTCYGCHGRGWVEVHGDSVQLTALFGLLKATDHAETKGERWPGDTHIDKLTFCEKNQVELTGKDGGPMAVSFIIGKGYKDAQPG